MVLSLILLVALLYNSALVYLILTRTKPSQPGRCLVWYIICISAWIGCEMVIDFPGVDRSAVLWLSRAMYMCSTAMTISFLFFCSVFPTPSPQFRQIAWVLSLMGAPWIVLAWTPLINASVTRFPWQDHITTGPLRPFYTVWLLICTIVLITHLIYKGKHSTSLERLQAWYMLLGMSIMAATGLFCNLVLPILMNSTPYGYIGPLSSLAVSTTVTYAILRYRLLDIHVIIRTGLVYSIAIGGLSLLFAFLVPILDTWLAPSFNPNHRISSFALALLMAMFFNPLRRWLERILDTYFFKSSYDYRQTLQHSGNAFASTRDRALLMQLLSETITSTIKPLHVTTYLPDAAGNYIRQDGDMALDTLPLRLQPDALFPRFAGHHDDIILTAEFLRQSDDMVIVGYQLQGWHVEAALPFLTGDSFLGWTFLGAKQSGDALTADDRALLAVLRKHVALALDNAQHYDELRTVNTALEQRVQERTGELEEALARLRSADRAKDDFLAMLSHEMLSPLTSILGWSDMAYASKDPTLAERSLLVIHRNALRQKRLVDDLLDISRIVHGKLSLAFADCEVWGLVQQAVEALHHQALDAKLTINAIPPTEAVYINADAIRIVQVISNLMTNAIKFSPQGGEITVSVRRVNTEAVIEVRDNGQGIPADDLARIFDPFAQGNQNRAVSGLGIGLALVKGIVDLHGGRVVAASEGIDCGSTFTVGLPLVLERVIIPTEPGNNAETPAISPAFMPKPAAHRVSP